MYFKEEVEPSMAALQQFSEGLDINNLLATMRANKALFKTCFVHQGEEDFDILVELFHPDYSEKGSNRYVKEVDIFKYFHDFLETCFYNGQ